MTLCSGRRVQCRCYPLSAGSVPRVGWTSPLILRSPWLPSCPLPIRTTVTDLSLQSFSCHSMLCLSRSPLVAGTTDTQEWQSHFGKTWPVSVAPLPPHPTPLHRTHPPTYSWIFFCPCPSRQGSSQCPASAPRRPDRDRPRPVLRPLTPPPLDALARAGPRTTLRTKCSSIALPTRRGAAAVRARARASASARALAALLAVQLGRGPVVTPLDLAQRMRSNAAATTDCPSPRTRKHAAFSLCLCPPHPLPPHLPFLPLPPYPLPLPSPSPPPHPHLAPSPLLIPPPCPRARAPSLTHAGVRRRATRAPSPTCSPSRFAGSVPPPPREF